MRARQPFAVVGFSFAAVLFLCCWLTTAQMTYLIILSLLSVAAGVCFFIKRKGAALLLFSLMALSAAVISLSHQNDLLDIYETIPEKAVTLTGQAVSGTAEEGIFVRNAALSWEGGSDEADLILYGNDDLIIYPGETFSLSASLQGMATAAQQGKGAQLIFWGDASSLKILQPQPLVHQLCSTIRSRLSSNIYSAVPDSEAAAMTIAVLTGDDGAIPRRTYSLYQRSGIAHILCVSGLHLSILSGIILAVLTLIGRRPALLLSMLSMGGFVWFTGSGPSVVRAWIMVCLIMSAELFRRDAAPANSLGLAVLILTLSEPALVCRMGFLLSVTSVLAITVVAPSWQTAVIRIFTLEEKTFPVRLLQFLLPSAAVSLMTLPVMYLFTGYVPVSSLLINMVVLPLMPCLLISGLITGLTGWSVTGVLCQKILIFFGHTAEIGAKGLILPLRSEFALIGVAGCIILAALVFLLKGRDLARIAAGILSVVILCGSYAFDVLSRQDKLIITQYAFSKGSSIVLQHENNAIVVGTGGKPYEGQKLAAELLANGVQTIDALIIPSDKLAYTGGSYDVLTSMGANTVIAPDSSRVTHALDYGKTEHEYPLAGSRWKIFGSGTLDIHTGGEQAVITVEWNGRRILLDYSGDPVPWPADIRLVYDKSTEEPDTTRQNYAIMISSDFRLAPVTKLMLPEETTPKGVL